jgi:hypothetical protein
LTPRRPSSAAQRCDLRRWTSVGIFWRRSMVDGWMSPASTPILSRPLHDEDKPGVGSARDAGRCSGMVA